ncbi:MAG: DUF2442 domain-containing protein [Firmicutes bacterium]|nr:DUF2442 domain-containing protein [Bacillota bacterium]
MRKITKVRVFPGYRLELEFDDGVSGSVDLILPGRQRSFRLMGRLPYLRRVRIGSSGELVWNNKIDLCPDSLYLKIRSR